MSKVKVLLKYSIKNQFGKSSEGGKGNKGLFLYGFTVLFLMVVAVVLFGQLNHYIGLMGAPKELFLVVVYLLVAAFVFTSDVIKAPGLLFNVKDYQMLSTLPVTSREIITAKVIELLLINYVFALMISAPAFLIYFKANEFSLLLLALLLTSIIMIPIIPMCVGILIGYIVYKVSSKFKFREMIITALYIVMLLSGILLMYCMEQLMPIIVQHADLIISIATKINMPMQLYLNMVMNLSIVDFILFTGLSLIFFGALIFIIGNQFTILNSRFDVVGKDEERSFKRGKKQSKVISLLKLEFLKYISKSVVVFNTLGTGILYIIYIIAEKFNAFGDMSSFGSGFSFTLVLGVFSLGLNPTTVTSISLEGSAFNIKKSLPIEPRDIILSKILLNIVVLTPIVLLGFILNVALGSLTVQEAILNALVLELVIVATGCMGMLINLNIYDLNWTSEAAVVKKGKSVLVSMVPSLAVLTMAMLFTTSTIDLKLVFAGLYGVIFIVSGIILYLKGEDMYNKIS